MARARIEERSAGGVVVRRANGGYDVCLILRLRHGQRAWCLPKGHLEAGEDAPAAAVREVREETGLACDIVEPLGHIAYEFDMPQPPARCAKTVEFFLMRTPDEMPRPADREAVDARWLALGEAAAQATYENEREVLARARRALDRPEIAARLRGA
ncbi:MAG: NUDIX hydrolase [Candidatus Omnitrophica bacterium]|nr:NUDIX hydrolase [Candidatus Omnitrophota bacterium]